ncbi:MAG TPA: hypothetical protein VGJ20_07855 [Xanthobacteraceae bacterium]
MSDDPFFDMEEPLRDALGLARALSMAAAGLSDEYETAAIMALASEIEEKIRTAKECWKRGVQFAPPVKPLRAVVHNSEHANVADARPLLARKLSRKQTVD